MRDVPISWGFLYALRNRFTVTLGERITIAATGESARDPRRKTPMLPAQGASDKASMRM